MDKTCSGCSKTIKTKSISCEHCMNIYHPSCTTLKAVRNTHNITINACRSCIAEANSRSRTRSSNNDKDNNDHPNINNSANNSSTVSTESADINTRTHVPNSSSDPLQLILEKLTKLESLDKRFTDMQASFDTRFTDLQSSFVTRFTEVKTTLNTRLDDVSSRMTILEGRPAPLDDLPLLSARVSAAEEVITKVQAEQANLCRRLDELCAINSAAAPDATSIRRIEKLETNYEQLNAAQQKLSAELLITGLPITDNSSLKGVVYTALKLLDVELLENDIRHVRKMSQKPSSVPLNNTIPTTVAEELKDINAGGSPTMAPQITSQSTRVDTRPRIPPLIVTLSSHLLAVSLVNAKMRMGKMHSSQLSIELLKLAKVTTPLQPSVININEFLPPELHRLRLQARTEAKKKGFITYVRGGRLYIKKKKEDQATIISSTEELNHFLA